MTANVRFLVLFFFLVYSLGCQKNDDIPVVGSDRAPHPRILLLEGEEQNIQSLIDSDPTWARMHGAILKESNKILSKPELERVMVGRRLLSTSRQFLKRSFYLSYAYRMTGDDRFLQKAEKEMLAVCAFTDWNPSHFLDVAEMTMGLAIGYDWLYDKLNPDSRKIISDAIAHKGLEPSYNSDYNWFLRSSNNWNQVCNAGMTFGAMAIEEDHPLLAEKTIERALESIPLPMEDYKPDGAYPEGYGYWGYGTSFNVMFLSAMEKKMEGGDLAHSQAFLNTAEFLQHMVAPSKDCFNWGDNGLRGRLNPAMFWLGAKGKNPSLLWSEKAFLDTDDFSKFTKDLLLPALMIWGKEIPIEAIEQPPETTWIGQGKNPVFMTRTSWTDPNAIYLGFKAGSPSVNHGHMDIGSFVMEADGVRWASDLGIQNYESLESKGLKIFGKTQDAQRWTIFRMNNYSHNTVTIDGELQRVGGYAQLDRHGSNDGLVYGISDLSTVYAGQVKKIMRGGAVVDQRYVVIRDEIVTESPVTLRWNMVTYADVQLNKHDAVLTEHGKKLELRINGNFDWKMNTWSTAPANDYDAENPGTIMVGFESSIPADSNAFFEVLLVPEREVENAPFIDRTLENW